MVAALPQSVFSGWSGRDRYRRVNLLTNSSSFSLDLLVRFHMKSLCIPLFEEPRSKIVEKYAMLVVDWLKLRTQMLG